MSSDPSPTPLTQVSFLASAGNHFRNGDLSAAIAAATAAVKAAPRDAAPRLLLAELSLFTGDLQRAETLVSALAALDAGTDLIASEFRQLLRAETQRRAVLHEGAVPEFIAGPTASQKESLRALTALRAEHPDDAFHAATAAEVVRPRTAGTFTGSNGQTFGFDDLRDIDDILCGSLEVLTTTGKCYWLAIERLIEVTFHAPQRIRDLYWRRATVVVRDGPEGDVYLPVLYDPPGESDALRLGRATTWSDGPHTVRGSGQKTFLIGENAQEIMGIGSLVFPARAS